MNEQETYARLCQTDNGLGYELGLVTSENIAESTPIQFQLYTEAKQRVGENEIDAVSFSGDAPIAYFRVLSEYDAEHVRELHKRIWNQSRVPSLYIVTPSELRIYNCYDEPVEPNEDIELRLVHRINVADEVLSLQHTFAKIQFDSGEFWKSSFGRTYKIDQRVESHLLKQLKETRRILHTEHGLPYPIIHDLLGRAIFILYLEDRKAIREGYYAEQFLDDAESFVDVLKNRESTYRLFDALAIRFNGDLLPVTEEEREQVKESDLAIIRNLFGGGDVETGQMALWRPYDFRAIPIELVSAIYEEFLQQEQGAENTRNNGAYYTPLPLVEFVMNEILPWPSPNDHRFDLRVLDLACGSGIFLVEAYRRLIARWIYSHEAVNIDPEQLKKILTSCIFGIDINPDAIRVTAFSLYLALLDHLSPRTIWEQFQFPYMTYVGSSDVEIGYNLFPLDTFSEDAPFERNDFDLVVGNPPWKRANLPENIAKYCQQHGIAQELAQAFAWRARDFSESGNIALIINSKTLFNNGTGDKNFRRKLLRECQLHTVVNFSALRKKKGSIGKKMFASAVGPATVIFYNAYFNPQAREEILYCNPKPTRLDNSLPQITIDASEIQHIPRQQFIDSDWTWKIGMWGTQRDYLLIEKLNKAASLNDYIYSRGWHKGVGIEVPGGGNKRDPDLEDLPLIKTSSIKRFWGMPAVFERERLGDITYRQINAKETFFAPHILIKQGQRSKRFCSAYFNYDCAFKHGVYGIASNDDSDVPLLKALVAYLNSSFASYFLFLTVATWGVERERVNFRELLKLPSIPFEMSPASVMQLADKVDGIGAALQANPKDEITIKRLESEIDELILDDLSLSDNESLLIQDVLDFSIDFFQKGEKSKACDITYDGQLQMFASTLCKSLNSILRFGQTTVWASVYQGSPLNIVTLHFNSDQPADTVMTLDVDIQSQLQRINKNLRQEYNDNIYLRRHIKLYSNDSIDIVKPNEQRFWSRSTALKDADTILSEGVLQGES